MKRILWQTVMRKQRIVAPGQRNVAICVALRPPLQNRFMLFRDNVAEGLVGRSFQHVSRGAINLHSTVKARKFLLPWRELLRTSRLQELRGRKRGCLVLQRRGTLNEGARDARKELLDPHGGRCRHAAWLCSAGFLEFLQHPSRQRFRNAIHFPMPMRESSRLCFQRLHFVESEAREAQVATGARVILDQRIMDRSVTGMLPDVTLLDAEQVPVHEVVHEQPELRLRAR